MIYFDKNCRQVLAGDIIKVFHFETYSGRDCYMYKKVYKSDAFGKVDLNGESLVALNLLDLGDKPIEHVHTCPLEFCQDFEIIDGHDIDDKQGGLICWWERKKNIVYKKTN